MIFGYEAPYALIYAACDAPAATATFRRLRIRPAEIAAYGSGFTAHYRAYVTDAAVSKVRNAGLIDAHATAYVPAN